MVGRGGVGGGVVEARRGWCLGKMVVYGCREEWRHRGHSGKGHGMRWQKGGRVGKRKGQKRHFIAGHHGGDKHTVPT